MKTHTLEKCRVANQAEKLEYLERTSQAGGELSNRRPENQERNLQPSSWEAEQRPLIWISAHLCASGRLHLDGSRGHRCAGSEFNSQGFMRRLAGQPARLATADLYSHESRQCHLQTGVKQMPH